MSRSRFIPAVFGLAVGIAVYVFLVAWLGEIGSQPIDRPRVHTFWEPTALTLIDLVEFIPRTIFTLVFPIFRHGVARDGTNYILLLTPVTLAVVAAVYGLLATTVVWAVRRMTRSEGKVGKH